MSIQETQDRLIVAEEDVAAVMLHVEAGEFTQAQTAVNLIAAAGKTRMAWVVLRLAEMLQRQEAENERLLDRQV